MENAQYLETVIKDSGIKKTHLAKCCGITRQSFAKKCKNPKSFTAEQIAIICRELKITQLSKRQEIFFV